MKEVKLAKDWEIMNNRVVRAGSRVMVPNHIAKQLKEQGFLQIKSESKNQQ